ncbi:unnamed protein product [Ectocarpus sp. 12 AP-2014]
MRDPCTNSTDNACALQARDISKHFHRSSGLIHPTPAIDDDKGAHSLGCSISTERSAVDVRSPRFDGPTIYPAR